jgi:hypothetical protein
VRNNLKHHVLFQSNLECVLSFNAQLVILIIIVSGCTSYHNPKHYAVAKQSYRLSCQRRECSSNVARLSIVCNLVRLLRLVGSSFLWMVFVTSELDSGFLYLFLLVSTNHSVHSSYSLSHLVIFFIMTMIKIRDFCKTQPRPFEWRHVWSRPSLAVSFLRDGTIFLLLWVESAWFYLYVLIPSTKLSIICNYI